VTYTSVRPVAPRGGCRRATPGGLAQV